MSRRKVSLSSELHLITRAIDGSRLITEKWRDGHFMPDELPRLAHALHATLVIVRERLLLLDRGVRDTIDPRYLFCTENEAFEAQLGEEDGDVVLQAWSAKQEAKKLRKEADRAAHRVEVLAERRKRRKENEHE
jgi:hypothetical protein